MKQVAVIVLCLAGAYFLAHTYAPSQLASLSFAWRVVCAGVIAFFVHRWVK